MAVLMHLMWPVWSYPHLRRTFARKSKTYEALDYNGFLLCMFKDGEMQLANKVQYFLQGSVL